LDQHDKRRIGIIGGGLSGLATAVQLHLADPSLELTLLEASGRTGGVIQTERVDQFIIDHGADMFATQPPAALRLCQQLGIDGDLLLPKEQGRGAKIVRRGSLVPIPDGFVLMRATQTWPMLTTPLLSPWGKLRWACERWVTPTPPDRDLSVGQFVRQRLGKEVLERIVAPLVAGIYTADVDRLSMQATMGPILAMQRKHGSLAKATAARKRAGEDSVERQSAGARYSQFRAFPQGTSQFIEALGNALPEGTVRLNAAVATISPTTPIGDTSNGGLTHASGSWQVILEGDSPSLLFDHLVLATPPMVSARLLHEVAPVAAQELATIESASTAIVVMVVRRADITRPANTFGFVVPPIEGRSILACSFASEKFAGRAPEDHVIIRVFIGGTLQSDLLDRDDDELRHIARRELSDLIGLRGEPVLDRVVRWNQAMPQYQVGHLDRVARIEAALEPLGSLSLVSNALHGVGIAPIIAAAGQVAEKIVGSLA